MSKSGKDTSVKTESVALRSHTIPTATSHLPITPPPPTPRGAKAAMTALHTLAGGGTLTNVGPAPSVASQPLTLATGVTYTHVSVTPTLTNVGPSPLITSQPLTLPTSVSYTNASATPTVTQQPFTLPTGSASTSTGTIPKVFTSTPVKFKADDSVFSPSITEEEKVDDLIKS